MKKSYNIVQNKFSKNNDIVVVKNNRKIRKIQKYEKKKNTQKKKIQKYSTFVCKIPPNKEQKKRLRWSIFKVQNNIISKDQTTINITIYKIIKI